MLCPNDNTEMHQVKTLGHYGGPIIVDQCEKCGGIWFDEAELFRAKQGEAEKIELLNTEILRTPSAVENSTLFYPRDKAAMHRFTDKYFPEDIILLRCPLCHGIWLNRGMFTKYQRFRQKLMPPKKTSPQDEKLGKTVAYLVKSYERGRSPEELGRLGEFLSTSIGRTENSGCPSEGYYTPDGIAIADGIADFLATILRKLIMPF